MMLKKKMISMIMVLCMILSMLPMGILAAGPTIQNGVYIIANSNAEGTMISGKCVPETRNYGYLYDDYTVADGDVRCQYVFTHVSNGQYTITDYYGRYLGVSGTYKSFQLYSSNQGAYCLWTVTAGANGEYVVKNASNGSIIDYSVSYGSFGAYQQGELPEDGLISLIYVGKTEPEKPVEPGEPVVPVELDGKECVIYAPAYGMALSSQKLGHYNLGVSISVSGGTVSGYGDTEKWRITNNADGTICISQNGKNLALADTFSSMNLGEVHDKWVLQNAGNGMYYVKNVARGNYIEWYNEKNNWSSYGVIAAGNEGQFALILAPLNGSAGDNSHGFENGFCSHCSEYEPAVLKNGTYEIYNAGQLYWFAAQVNGGKSAINGKLMDNIQVNKNVLTGDGKLNGNGSSFREWTPISNENIQYTGSFDGNGKTISGLYYDNTRLDHVGLFGYVGEGGRIENVGVVDSYLRCNTEKEDTSGCDPYGKPVNKYDYVGGLAACNSGTIIGCYNSSTLIVVNPNVTAWNICAGGVVGSNTGTVSECYNTGSVSGSHSASSIGGVVGTNWSDIHNCYNTGTITGNSRVGGVAGSLYGDTVNNCYNSGSISGVSSGGFDIGGVIGMYDSGTVSNCFYLAGCVTGGNFRGTSKSKEAFASGEVCFLLQADQKEQIWGQKLGTDPYPLFCDDEVYNVSGGYSNVGQQLPAPGVTLSGKVTSYLEGNATVALVQGEKVVQSVVTTGNRYAMEKVAPGIYTLCVTKADHVTQVIEITVGEKDVTMDVKICPKGDITGDGVVNIKDFQRLLRHVNKTNPLSDYELLCGDVTGDDVCNIKDFQRLLRHVNKTNPLF